MKKDWVGFLIGGIIVLVVVLISFYLYDSLFPPGYESGVSTVVGKEYHAPYTSMIQSGKTSVPSYHPARWAMDFNLNGVGEVSKDVSEDFYASTRMGETVYLRYHKGRVSKYAYVDGYSLVPFPLEGVDKR